jgi:hypothetical protein
MSADEMNNSSLSRPRTNKFGGLGGGGNSGGMLRDRMMDQNFVPMTF